MGSKVFAKQLTLLLVSTTIILLSACSEVVELPETASADTQKVEQETSLARPTTVSTTATPAPETQTPTEVQTETSTDSANTQTSTPESITTETQTSPEETVTEATTTPSTATTETTTVTEPQSSPDVATTDSSQASLAPDTTAEPVASLSQPSQPNQTSVTEPVTSEPVTSEPAEPVVTEPNTSPVIVNEPQEPIQTAVTEPETQISPEPTVITEPAPVDAEPVVSEPEPTPEPVVVEPTPEPVTEPTNAAGVWQPTPGTTWQWQLNGTLDLSFDVDMYDIDLFDTPKSTIQGLQAEGRIVICYFSAGSLEPWRTDASQFPQEVIGSKMHGWDEFWLDVSKYDRFATIMTARLDLAAEKGCDGVEPDNVDAYQNESGFPLSYQDQLNYNIFLAEEAHKRNLSIGLKNDLEQVVDLEPYFDWALNESCFQWNECHMLLPFIENNKAVFGVEYTAPASEFCDLVNGFDYDFLKKDYDLKAPMQPCRNQT